MSEIESLSHVDLLDAYDAAQYVDEGDEARPIRAEILRRMDSACTSRRLDIAPDHDGHQR